jgi:hypothetical protein
MLPHPWLVAHTTHLQAWTGASAMHNHMHEPERSCGQSVWSGSPLATSQVRTVWPAEHDKGRRRPAIRMTIPQSTIGTKFCSPHNANCQIGTAPDL